MKMQHVKWRTKQQDVKLKNVKTKYENASHESARPENHARHKNGRLVKSGVNLV